MRYKVKKSHFYYISKDSILKSLVIYAISLAIMEVMNIIIWINYEDVIRTWLILHITVVTAPYPHEKEQITFSLTIKYWRVSRVLARVLNQSQKIQFKKNNNLNLKVKWNHHTTRCSLTIMSTSNVNQQNSQAHILSQFYSGQIALIWKEIRFFCYN